MKLISTSKVISNLNLRDIDAVNTEINLISDRVTDYLAAIIRTGFDRGTYADDFYFTPQSLLNMSVPYIPFELSRGFVDSGQTVTIKVAESHKALSSAGVGTLDSTDYVVDYEKGFVKVFNTDVLGPFFRIEYTAGFTLVSGIASGVPSWLTTAAYRYIAHVYHVQKAANDPKQKSTLPRPDIPPEDVSMLMASHIRAYHNALKVM